MLLPKLTVNELYKSLSKIKDDFGDCEIVAMDNLMKLMTLKLLDKDGYIDIENRKLYIFGDMIG